MSEQQRTWELHKGDEILGTLMTNGWGAGHPPWFGCDLTPAPAYKKYMKLFERYSRKVKVPRLQWVFTHSGLAIPTSTISDKIQKWEKRRQELHEEITLLNLTLVPMSSNAQPGRVIEILINGKSVQMIAEFDELEEAES